MGNQYLAPTQNIEEANELTWPGFSGCLPFALTELYSIVDERSCDPLPDASAAEDENNVDEDGTWCPLTPL